MEGSPFTFGSEHETPPTFEERMWLFIEELSGSVDALRSEQEATCERLALEDVTNLSLHQQEMRANEEEEYVKMHTLLTNLEEREAELLDVFELYTSGGYGENDVIAVIPELDERADDETQAQRPIRKSTSEMTHEEWVDSLDRMSRRLLPNVANTGTLTTGRNRTRVVTGRATSNPILAEALFFEQTADTHGGKVRKPNTGRSYYTKGGRQIRKY